LEEKTRRMEKRLKRIEARVTELTDKGSKEAREKTKCLPMQVGGHSDVVLGGLC
jgi:hypothetical protein